VKGKKIFDEEDDHAAVAELVPDEVESVSIAFLFKRINLFFMSFLYRMMKKTMRQMNQRRS